MVGKQDPDLGEVACAIVRGTFGGLYTHSLRRTIYGHGLPVLRDNLAKTLLERQQSGELNFRDRKWHVPTVALESGPPPDLPNVDVPLRVTRPGHLPAIPADVLAGSLIGDDEEQAAIATANVGWDLFRRLIPHYVDCLHLSGATRISQYTDRWKQQFHLLRPKGPWWPDEAGPRILRIDRRDLGADFLEGLYRRRTEPLLLGYPISISHGSEDKIFVTPVTLLQCQWKVDDTALLLWPTEVAPRLNTDWVGRNRRRRDLTKMRMWLRETASGEDSGIASVGDEGWSDIPDMASSLEMFLARDVAEQLAPASLEPRLDLGVDDKIHNVLGLFLVVPNPYTIGCRRDLEAMQKLPDKDLAKTALAAVFADVPGVGSIEFAPSVASPLDLSEDQLVATINGLSHPLTVISGPPGTGKSQVVCALMISAALAGRSVLFASHSHKALDAVQERMKEIAPDHVLLARARTEDGDQNFDFRAAIDFLLGRLVDSNLEVPIAARRRAIEIRHKELQHLLDHTDELSRTTDDLGRFTEELERRRVEIEFRQTSLSGLGRRPPSLWRRLFGWLVDLWGRTKKSRVDTIDPMRVPEEKLLSDAELSRRIRGVEAKHKALTAEVEKLTRDRPLADMLKDLLSTSKEALPDLVRSMECAHTDERGRLTDLMAQAGLIRDAEGQRNLWDANSDVILRHFPLWACTALSVPNRIPFVPGLFDYLIVDEATTCNIAQSLPLLARAKRVVIVGDRLQTGMVSDLDGRRENEMLRRAGLSSQEVGRFSFSQVSLFDLMTSCPSARRLMLRDHFRCDPEIADYVSDTFYGGRLFVRTDVSTLRPPSGTRTGLHWTNIVGPLEPAGTGCRSQSEAMAIADHLHDLLEIQNYTGTVGVVTPFKRQSELIIRLVEQRISRERIEATQLLIATAHKFQGGARDVVLISLCYGATMPRGAAWFLQNSRELINVAVSRAKAVCHIFGDRTAAEKSSIRHIKRLAQPPARTKSGGDTVAFESPWERRLYERLVADGFDPIPQYPLAGRRLDLAIIHGDVRIDIEVDGETYHRDPDGFRKASDHWRDHVISSLGWRVCRFWVYQLRDDMEGCVERVRKQLG